MSSRPPQDGPRGLPGREGEGGQGGGEGRGEGQGGGDTVRQGNVGEEDGEGRE